MKKLIKKPKSVKTETVQSNSESENKINNSPKGLKKLPAKLKLTKKKLLIILVTILVLTSLGYLGMFLGNKYLWPPKPYCYIRLAHLVCMDMSTLEKTRYDLPRINNEEIQDLLPSYDQKHYIASILNKENGINRKRYYLLDDNLSNPKKLPNQKSDDTGYRQLGNIVWSIDNKSLFYFSGYSSSYKFIKGDLYKYDVINNKVNNFKLQKYYDNLIQLKDNRLIYDAYNDVMASSENGTNPQPFGNEQLNNKTYGRDWSYDNNSDTVFFWTYHPMSNTSKVGAKVYYDEATQTLSYFSSRNEKKTKTIEISLDMSTEGFLFFRNSGNKIIALKSSQHSNYDFYYDDNKIQNQGAIIDKKTGKIENDLEDMGIDVGFINPTKLTKSKQQAEQPHERIIGLYKAPEVMKAIIIKEFDAKDAKCNKEGQYNSLEFYIYYRNNKEIEFGTGIDSCAYSKNLYRNTDEGWVKFIPISPMNGLHNCADLDKYKISAKEYPKCNDDKYSEVPNKNP